MCDGKVDWVYDIPELNITDEVARLPVCTTAGEVFRLLSTKLRMDDT